MRENETVAFGLKAEPREEVWDDVDIALAPDVACEEMRLLLDFDAEEVEVDARVLREHLPECPHCQRMFKAATENGAYRNAN
jgi:hypothetical protein